MRTILLLIVLVNSTIVPAQTAHLQTRRAENFYDQKNWGKAGETFRQIEALPNAWFNLGNIAYRQKNHGEAIGHFENAAEKAGSRAEKADALFNLGNALLQNGQLKAAETAFSNSLRLAPNRPDAKKNLQITKKKLNEKPPPPPPPKPPPPPPSNPQRRYLDRAQTPQSPEPTAGKLSPEQARKLLENTVVPDEQKNLRPDRRDAPAGKMEKGKKGW